MKIRLEKYKGIIVVILVLFSVIIRIWHLDKLPKVINGDETGSIIHSTQISLGLVNSPFDLTHDGSVSYTIFYYKALILNIFGENNALLAIRLSTVIMSIGVIIIFLHLSLKYFNFWVAVITTTLLSTSYWFINFSRISWICIDSVFWGLLGVELLISILKTHQWKYYFAEGIVSGIILYNYMGGRIYVMALLISLFVNIFKDKKVFLLNLMKYGLMLLIMFLVFLPQSLVIKDNWETYSLRARSIMIIDLNNSGFKDKPKEILKIIQHQFMYSVRGLLIFDPNYSGEGVENQRLVPKEFGAINMMVRVLFLIGIGAVIILKHNIGIFFLIICLLNILCLQIPSANIPSWSRAIGILPAIYFISGVAINYIWQILNKKPSFFRKASKLLLMCLLLITALADVKKYYLWVNSDNFNYVQEPAIETRDFNYWYRLQKTGLLNNREVFSNYDWKFIKEAD